MSNVNKCKASVMKTEAGWTVRVTTPDFEFNESYTTPREARATLEAVQDEREANGVIATMRPKVKR